MRTPQRPPALRSPLEWLELSNAELFRAMSGCSPTMDGRYLHWDEIRHRTPPPGLTVAQWWEGIKVARTRVAQRVEAMERVYGSSFTYASLPPVQHALHDFDRVNVGAEILAAMGNPDAQIEYRVRQLIEEAISSSEIEGARPTTREIARQMLREKRTPASRDERMILNNLRAMERLGELHRRGSALSLEHLLELHRILGEGALEVDGAEGKLRTSDHAVVVDDVEGNVWHIPPSATGIESRVRQLLAFANGSTDGESQFLHPIIRAIITHFWMGYEHPFRDGNGRIARALYYWCMLRHGYEVAEFLSISGPIDRSPKAYYLAFAYVESDDGDLTYFINHQLEVMRAALDDLLEHLRLRAERLRALASIVASYDELNHRQRSILEFAIRHPNQGQTIEGCATSYAVHYLTARSDLIALKQRGLLFSKRVGKKDRYYPSSSFLAAGPGSRP